MDPIDKVKIFNSLEESNAARLQKLVDRQAIAKKQTPSSVYVGQSEDGRSLVKPVGGAIVPLRTIGNIQPSMGEIVRAAAGSADAGTNILRQSSRRPSRVGEVTVLVSRVVAGQTELWLGGDRPAIQIATIPSTSIQSLNLERTGPSKSDWLVAIKYNSTAKMISGNGSHDWEVTDGRVGVVNYLGNGFWGQTQNLYGANPSSYAVQEDTIGSSVLSLYSALGLGYAGAGCHSGIEGLSTIAVEYCEDYSLTSPSQLSSESGSQNEGIVTPAGSPVVFSGTNISTSRTVANAVVEGGASGPGYLGPGGSSVDPLEPPIIGAATFPTKKAWQESTYTRSFSSQVYNFSLYNGTITELSGQRSVSASSESRIDLSSGGTIKSRNYRGSPGEFNFPGNYLWTIFVTASEGWPFSPGGSSQTTSALSTSVSSSKTIAPGVTKRYDAQITAASYLEPTQGVGSSDFSFAGNCFVGGYSWSQEVANAQTPGEAFSNADTGFFGFSFAVRTFKYYFNWGGTNIEASSTWGQLDRTWQPDESNSGLPKSTKAQLLNSSNIFTKSIDAEITISKAVTVSGKLTFQAESTKPKVKVMKIAVEGGSVRDSKYWAR